MDAPRGARAHVLRRARSSDRGVERPRAAGDRRARFALGAAAVVSPAMDIAVLGTGIMGAPMARNLRAAGHDVRAWNRSRDKAEPLADDGITLASDPAEAAAGADVVVTMLADAAAVHAVLVEGGALDETALLCQMSTIGIAGTEDVAHECATREVPFVDAPVLGTKQPAEQ